MNRVYSRDNPPPPPPGPPPTSDPATDTSEPMSTVEPAFEVPEWEKVDPYARPLAMDMFPTAPEIKGEIWYKGLLTKELFHKDMEHLISDIMQMYTTENVLSIMRDPEKMNPARLYDIYYTGFMHRDDSINEAYIDMPVPEQKRIMWLHEPSLRLQVAISVSANYDRQRVADYSRPYGKNLQEIANAKGNLQKEVLIKAGILTWQVLKHERICRIKKEMEEDPLRKELTFEIPPTTEAIRNAPGKAYAIKYGQEYLAAGSAILFATAAAPFAAGITLPVGAFAVASFAAAMLAKKISFKGSPPRKASREQQIKGVSNIIVELHEGVGGKGYQEAINRDYSAAIGSLWFGPRIYATRNTVLSAMRSGIIGGKNAAIWGKDVLFDGTTYALTTGAKVAEDYPVTTSLVLAMTMGALYDYESFTQVLGVVASAMSDRVPIEITKVGAAAGILLVGATTDTAIHVVKKLPELGNKVIQGGALVIGAAAALYLMKE